MNNQETYFLSTGEKDRLRLERLNKVYNPNSQAFILNNGLKPDMTVLELGCGTGQMACWLAQAVGPKGKVYAIDNSQAQLDIAAQHAAALDLNNITFINTDIRKLDDLNLSYDFIYARWILNFMPDPEAIIQSLLNKLTPGGHLVSEECNVKENAHYSYPHNADIDLWHELGIHRFASLKLDSEFPFNCAEMLEKHHCTDIKIQTHQPVLTTPEEKSIYYLLLCTIEEDFKDNSFISQQAFSDLKARMLKLQDDSTVAGFFRNILTSGQK